MGVETGLLRKADQDVPLEHLEVEIMSWSGNLAAATARLLAGIAEYDRREGWRSWEARSCADWLSWKCGDSIHTAREKVRVARALEQLPVTAAAFSAGELSYSKVRAITRVACAGDDAEWVEQAGHCTGAQLDRIVAGVRRALAVDENFDARAAFDKRNISMGNTGGGMSSIKLDGPCDMAKTVLAAVDMVASQIIDESVAGSGQARWEIVADRGGMASVRADALVQIAERALAAEPPAAERGDVGRLQVVVDTETLREIKHSPDARLEPDSGECTLGGTRVAPEIARRWACDIRASVVLDHDGHGRDEGRETRVLNRRLRRALHRRDHGACRFPGCGATSWLHAHHIVHWADGGHTDLDNLVSLCGFHHRVVHEGGWAVAIADRVVVWTDAGGIPATVELLSGDADHITDQQSRLGITAATIDARWYNDPLDFHFVVSVIAEHCVRARATVGSDVPAGTSSGCRNARRLKVRCRPRYSAS